jgi:hypothetical protein
MALWPTKLAKAYFDRSKARPVIRGANSTYPRPWRQALKDKHLYRLSFAPFLAGEMVGLIAPLASISSRSCPMRHSLDRPPLNTHKYSSARQLQKQTADAATSLISKDSL